MPDRDWDFVHLDLSVRIDPSERTLSGRARWSAERLNPEAAFVSLHQSGLNIASVVIQSRETHSWTQVGDVLRVAVPPHHDRVEIDIEYDTVPQAGVHFRGDAKGEVAEAWTQGQDEQNRHWFPGWDYPNDRFTIRTRITAPSELTSRANGVLESEQPAGTGLVERVFYQERPIPSYLVAWVVGDYDVIEAQAEGLPLEYIVPRGTRPGVVHQTFDRTEEIIPFFTDLLDEPFPYPIYRQSLAQRFMYGGMENATLTVLSASRRVATEHDPQWATERTIAHEIAHQWFGNLVTCHGWREMWLNEGLATYYAGRWQAHTGGDTRWAELLHGWHEGALADTSPMSRRSYSEPDGGGPYARVYVQGASVVHLLATLLGQDLFDRAIRTYLDRYRDSFVEGDDLRRVLADVSGRHLGWLFDQWVTGAGHAEIHTAWSYESSTLSVQVTQPEPTHTLPIDIEIGSASGTQQHRVWVTGNQVELVIKSVEPPDWVAVNHSGAVFAHWDIHQPVDAWVAQAERSASPYARIQAIRALGALVGPAPVERAAWGLVALLSDPEPILRAEAARALGELQSGVGLRSLRQALGDPDRRVRQAVAEALAIVGDPDIAATITDRFRREPAPEVRGALLGALGVLDPQAGRRWARHALARTDPSNRAFVHHAAADVLAFVQDPADLDFLTQRVSETRTSSEALAPVASAAVDLAKVVPVEYSGRRRLARKLDALLASRDIHMRSSTIQWLADVGDATSERALTRFAQRNRVRWNQLSERARDAALLIRTQERSEGDGAVNGGLRE